MSRDAEFARAPDADDVTGDEWVGAEVDAADSSDAAGGCFGVGFKCPGEGAGGASERGDVGCGAGEDLVACEAAGRCVDKVEARLGLGSSVHVGLCEHEVEVRADGVGEGEGGQAADENMLSRPYKRIALECDLSRRMRRDEFTSSYQRGKA